MLHCDGKRSFNLIKFEKSINFFVAVSKRSFKSDSTLKCHYSGDLFTRETFFADIRSVEKYFFKYSNILLNKILFFPEKNLKN